MKILLNCFPPAFVSAPSASLSILKAYLEKYEYGVDIVYWNIIFKDLFDEFKDSKKHQNVFLFLFPFLATLLKGSEDKEKYDRLCTYYQTNYPNLINVDIQNYYRDSLSNMGYTIIERYTEQITQIYDKGNYSLIGVSNKLLQNIPANIFSKISKELYPNTPIVIGGMGTKDEAVAQLENFDYYDYAIWGEGENPLHQLCRHLNGEISIFDVPNMVHRIEDAIKINNRNKKFYDLSKITPNYSEYFSQLKNTDLSNTKKIMIPIEGSRGCHWNKCKFCYLSDGYKNRTKNNDAVVSEILYTIENYKVFDFMFLDNDIIFNDFKKFDDLLNKLIKIKDKYEKFRIMHAEIITKGLNAAIIKKMVTAGFFFIQIGYEANSDSLLRKINKKNTLSSNIMFIKWSSYYNISIHGLNVITGFIGENNEDIIESIHNIHYLRFFLDKDTKAHLISQLQIMQSSRYYKFIESKGELDLWNDNALFHILPNNYIKEETRFNILSFGNVFKNKLWQSFDTVDKYYLSNNYSYKLIKINNDLVQYIEYFNQVQISKFEFDTNDYHWKVLQFCNYEVKSLEDMAEHFDIKDNEIEFNMLKSSILELQQAKILYSNLELTENIAIINSDTLLI